MVLDIEIDIDIGASNYCRPEGNNLLTYFYVSNKIRNIPNILLIFVDDLYEIESMRKSIKTLRSEKPTQKRPICYPSKIIHVASNIFRGYVYHIYLLHVDVKPSYID